jgi:hypothetical protein
MTAVTLRSAFSAPTAGSDHVNPTVFSAYDAVDFRSPNRRSFPPGVASPRSKLAV